ncbi:MAG: hypothetical protein LAN63_12205 [Acidobacteriia bacterium]|nr:hypothetical protein [Terriglobia bacterium]
MKTRIAVPAVLILAVILACPTFLAAQASRSASAGCAPNGNRFNLEPLANAVGQFNETVAVLPNRGGNGVDLVVGTALDDRSLPPIGFLGFPADAFYVQRDNSNCAADFEGEFPPVFSGPKGLRFDVFGAPVVVADPVHDAFFAADLRFSTGPDNNAVGVLKSTAATLLDATKCPNGTLQDPTPCWPTTQIVNKLSIFKNPLMLNPAIAVDQRTSGTGAGDVYVAMTQTDVNANSTISLVACTNSALVCGGTTTVTGSDKQAGFASLQVRADGGITISYVENTSLRGTIDIKFVNCAPAGAPNPPTCSAPVKVISEAQPMQVTLPGDEQVLDETYPRHVDRVESDGKTVTTFLVYDRCEVPVEFGEQGLVDDFCPKTDVDVLSSTDGGNTWSTLQKVSNSAGQQFLGALAFDASTSTVNIAYYSTEKDGLKLQTQVFLAQILPGQTTVSPPKQITSAFYDGGLSSDTPYIGIAAAGTGTAGQSHAYIHVTGSVVQGTYDGLPFPVNNNILTRFQY